MAKLKELLRELKGSTVDELLLQTPGVLFKALPFNDIYYHTERVVFWATKLAEKRGVDRDTVQLTAWLHDIGYVEDPKNHREVGAAAVEERLRELGLDAGTIEMVVDGIRNHGTRDSPQTDVGHILRFADALAAWDPQFLGFFLPVTPCKEMEGYRKTLEKKRRVLKEYAEVWNMEDTVERTLERAEWVMSLCQE